MTKQKLMDKIKPILKKGKAINDIIFVSKKMGMFDIAFTLLILRHTKEQQSPVYRLTHHDHNDYGWSDKDVNDYADNPMWGGDGIAQLVFGCLSALEVYTESEIITVLEAQAQWRKENE